MGVLSEDKCFENAWERKAIELRLHGRGKQKMKADVITEEEEALVAVTLGKGCVGMQ